MHFMRCVIERILTKLSNNRTPFSMYTDTSPKNKLIAKNTLALYFRMLFTMFVSLYTSRVVLNILGVDDYGIYNVVGGMVAIFSFLNGSMSAATQRFLSFAMGKGDNEQLIKIFNTTIFVHICIALVIIVLGETIAIWFLNHKMNIPPDRIDAANWVLHFSVISIAVNVIQVPYNAMIIAQEKMNVYAYFSIVEVTLKLLIAFLLPIFFFDKLKLYAVLTLGSTLVVMIMYSTYCIRKFHCKFRLEWTPDLLNSILGFASWNISAQLAWIARTQGVNILLNLFFGPSLNTARGIAVQVNGTITAFVSNFQLAVNPQIVKKYAQEEIKDMLKLLVYSSKYSYMLLYLLILPFLLELEYILKLWLHIVPEYVVVFTRLSLIAALVDTLSGTMVYGALATGKIKKYQLIMSGLFLLNPLVVYILFKIGKPPMSIYIIDIIFYLIALLTRLSLLHTMIGLSVQIYFKKVVFSDLAISLTAIILPLILHINMEESFFRFLLVGFLSVLSTSACIYLIGLDYYEKNKLKSIIRKYLKQ